MTLDDLTAEEERLRLVRESVVGLIGQKVAELERLGAFDAYDAVHREYARLGLAGDVEALKRAFFLQWYAAIEPGFITAIPGGDPLGSAATLDREVEAAVLGSVDRQLSETGSEFRLMVAWALSLVDYYFDEFGLLSSLRSRVTSSDEDAIWSIDPAVFEARGQMGEYFACIVASARVRGGVGPRPPRH